MEQAVHAAEIAARSERWRWREPAAAVRPQPKSRGEALREILCDLLLAAATGAPARSEEVIDEQDRGTPPGAQGVRLRPAVVARPGAAAP